MTTSEPIADEAQWLQRIDGVKKVGDAKRLGEQLLLEWGLNEIDDPRPYLKPILARLRASNITIDSQVPGPRQELVRFIEYGFRGREATLGDYAALVRSLGS